MSMARYNLREMPQEHHENILRDLFRAAVLAREAGDTPAADLNDTCIEVIFSAGKISNVRRLEIEIEVLASLAATESQTKQAAA